jgi:iron complex outermembrane receptor protein
MRDYRTYGLIIFLLMVVSIISAQSIHDTIALTEVNVFEKIDIAPIGSKADKIDSVFLSENNTSNLADLMMVQSPVFIKSYGYGALATPSFRGTSASQTQVLWNGIQLNSPMLGQMDFSLIPVFFVDDMHVHYGASSLQNSSGGIGGSINLINKPDWKTNRDLRFVQKIGSFHSNNTLLSTSFGNNKIQSKTKLFYSQSDNDFSYRKSNSNDSIYRRENAGYQAKGLLQEVYYRINAINIISGKLWIQQNYRDLPGNITVEEDSLIASQRDNTLKSVVAWNRFGDKGKTSAYAAFLVDDLIYNNSDLNIKTHNKSKVLKTHFQHKIQINKNHHLEARLSHQQIEINSDNYRKREQANIVGASLLLNSKLGNRLSYSLSLRYENFNLDQASGLMPMAGIEYFLFKNGGVTLYASLSKNNRFPTMNDLYWYPNGNPDLKPEVSRNAETGIKMAKSSNDFQLESQFGLYNSMIDNWIAWRPNSSSSLDWSPVNYKNVHSRGLESKIKASQHIADYVLKVNAMYSYTLTTNHEIYDEVESNILNKQLIYIPKNSFSANLALLYRLYSLSCVYSYTDIRYTQSDNMAYMPSYAFLDITFSRKFMTEKFTANAELKVKNLTDVHYQSIAYYPMPGRHFVVKLMINIHD